VLSTPQSCRSPRRADVVLERRQCASPGCERSFIPRSVAHKFCREHSRAKARNASEKVRYGWGHQRTRAQWAPAVATGKIKCARCGLPIGPSEPWDLGHVDGAGPRAYSGPEHARCNRATSGRNGKVTSWADLEERVPAGIVRCGLCGSRIRPDAGWQTEPSYGPVHGACEKPPLEDAPPLVRLWSRDWDSEDPWA
jgi:hypothetical protein